MGNATTNCVTGSIDGVTTAAISTDIRMAYRHHPSSRFDVTTPIFASPMITNGISNTSPVISSSRVTVSM